MNIEDISQFLREDYMFSHSDVEKIFKIYSKKFNNKKLKVTNKELRKLRESYYFDLARDKINDQDSKWAKDQLIHLEQYLQEKNKLELIFKRDINNYKSTLEEIDKKYFGHFKTYQNQNNICKKIKRKLEMLIDDKNNLDNIISNLNREMNNIKLINSMNKLKGTIINYGFNIDQGKKKTNIIESEIYKIMKKVEIVNEEVKRINLILMENVKYKLKYF